LGHAIVHKERLVGINAQKQGVQLLRIQDRAKKIIGRAPAPGGGGLALSALSDSARVGFKSPALCFCAGVLGRELPQASFIATYRPIEQVILSMYDMGKKGFYWARWPHEKTESGSLMLPFGAADWWDPYWQRATPLQQCAIRAISYFEGFQQQLRILRGRYLLITHRTLCNSFDTAVQKICRSLPCARAEGMSPFATHIRRGASQKRLSAHQREELHQVGVIKRAMEYMGDIFP
jgi:hypothetical protein